jgi:hypothetical protein
MESTPKTVPRINPSQSTPDPRNQSGLGLGSENLKGLGSEYSFIISFLGSGGGGGIGSPRVDAAYSPTEATLLEEIENLT